MFKKPAIRFFLSLLAVSSNLCAASELTPTLQSVPPLSDVGSTLQSGPISDSGNAPLSNPAVSPHPIIPSNPVLFVPFTGAVVGSKVRLRTQPSLEAHVIRETNAGELFAVMGESHDYYAIMPPKGTKGYVFRTFILDGKVEGERVNVRLSPESDAPVVAQLNKGDSVEAIVSSVNNKWLEIDLPESSRFYIAREYIENIGNIELAAAFEKKKAEATHQLTAASLFAQAEIQKPFEQIDFDRITSSLEKIGKDYWDIPVVAEQAKSTETLMQDIYVQKKIAFLEGKAGGTYLGISAQQKEKLAKIKEMDRSMPEVDLQEISSATSDTIGLAATLGDELITDKMTAWQPLEESIYHLWAAAHGEKSVEEFYAEEQETATTLSGIIEPYNRPVKNRPGDFLLKCDNLPVAFLYSTRINLEKLVGKKVTVIAAPRPNHHFAFPAYFVLNIE